MRGQIREEKNKVPDKDKFYQDTDISRWFNEAIQRRQPEAME